MTIFKAWVEDADINMLLQSGEDDNPEYGYSPSSFVQQIGNKYLLQRYKSLSPPPPQRHPAVADWERFTDSSSKLGMALRKAISYAA